MNETPKEENNNSTAIIIVAVSLIILIIAAAALVPIIINTTDQVVPEEIEDDYDDEWEDEDDEWETIDNDDEEDDEDIVQNPNFEVFSLDKERVTIKFDNGKLVLQMSGKLVYESDDSNHKIYDYNNYSLTINGNTIKDVDFPGADNYTHVKIAKIGSYYTIVLGYGAQCIRETFGTYTSTGQLVDSSIGLYSGGEYDSFVNVGLDSDNLAEYDVEVFKQCLGEDENTNTIAQYKMKLIDGKLVKQTIK